MAGTRRRPGVLGPHVDGYRVWLLGQGYAPETVRNRLEEFGQVGAWLAAEGLAVADLDDGRVEPAATAPGTRTRSSGSSRACAMPRRSETDPLSASRSETRRGIVADIGIDRSLPMSA